jgi:hypothetical protein
MRTTRVLLIVALAASLALPLAARAEEGGWKLPNLNPFSRPAGPPTSARTSSGSGLKMPSLWSKSSTKTAAARPKGPSTWQKMTTGTKSVVSKTADALNPFDDANDKVQQTTLVTGSKNKFRQASAQKKSESGSLWPSWLGGSEEPQKPKTVNEFLNQPRIQPE